VDLRSKQTPPPPLQGFQHLFSLNLKEHLFLSMNFKGNYSTDKAQYSKLSKNVSSPQVSPMQPLIFISIFSIDVDLLGSEKRSCYVFLKHQTRQNHIHLFKISSSYYGILTSRTEK